VLVSVIVPTFNRAHTVGDAVRSVLGQSCRELELIVVDDGSTDHTAEVLDSIRDVRMRVLRQENRGVSAARNAGIAASKGELLALLDSDDTWHGAKLERQVRFMSEGGWAVSQTEETWIRNGRRVNQPRSHSKAGGWIFERSLRTCLISPSCTMLTRAAWQRFGPFDERLPACEDYHLWLKIAAQVPVGLLPERLTVKTGGHSDQLSRRIVGLDLYRIKALVDLLGSGSLDFEQESLCRKELEARAMRYVMGCLKRGRQEEARRVGDLVASYLA
jgi:glycosyltransferase involved in cell wall biosynthesis